ncbi:helix-turn-helix domain-containing protein [Streptomyces olivaceus]|uniref:helix-turn-helix domain-containing protein n=1 Tax=Streptomyces olivaceus TaxID=47716 RepID=UPI001CCE10C6|nr:helix-turn-helix domain-containing protein [Streptomyces olivaceus]MBZ6253650.1 helix-turn-helix domain-containing protein [Streptomyces olivaceus]
MSTTHIGGALDTPADISPTERLVLAFLAQYAAPDGIAFPTISHLASRANVSSGTITRALHRLLELGLIQRAVHDDLDTPAWRVTLPASGDNSQGRGQG